MLNISISQVNAVFLARKAVWISNCLNVDLELLVNTHSSMGNWLCGHYAKDREAETFTSEIIKPRTEHKSTVIFRKLSSC